MSERILVVEDAPRVMRLIREVLLAVGYEVLMASTGESALQTAALEQPDLILLDIMLPQGMDGYDVCRRLREFSERSDRVPVIMLTAKARHEDVLAGFDAGADDYVTKPFNAKELVARVRARSDRVLRRSRQPERATASSAHCGDLEIDFARRMASVRGTPVALTRTEYSLLRELALNANRVIPHEDLLTAVWGQGYRSDIDYLRAYGRYLRKKLEPDPSNPQYIVTSPGVGYMLTCPDVEQVQG